MADRTRYGKMLDYLYIQIKMTKYVSKRCRTVKKRIRLIGGGYKLTKTDKKGLKEYWKSYGKKPKKYWYRLYCARRNSFDPRYIPDTMWYRDIYPYYNRLPARYSYADKGMFDTLFADLKRPDTIVKNMAGLFYTGDMELISQEEAIRRCAKQDRFIIKPTILTGEGKSILFFDKGVDAEEKKIKEIFDSFEVNFIVQNIIEQHPILAAIHEKSVNTIRVQSFLFQGEVYILSAQLRMGGGESLVDNVSAGGFACPIQENGWLEDKAVNRKSEWVEQHDSGVFFRDICVPSFNLIIETIKRKHCQLPYFRIIGWDFAVDKEGDPVFIEFNVRSEPNQIASGPTFGNITEQVLEDVFIDKPMKDYFLV